MGIARAFTLLLAAALCMSLGCGSTVSGIVASTANPLVAQYTVGVLSSANISIEFGEDTSYGRLTSAQHTSPSLALVAVLVAGMKGSTTYHMRARIEYDNGDVAHDIDRVFTTGSVPPGILPNYTVNVNSALTPQPGVELVDIVPSTQASFAFATDLDGSVIWFYTPPESQIEGATIYPVKLLPNGHFMCIIGLASQSPLTIPITPSAPNVLREFDLAGNTVRELTVADLNSRMAAAHLGPTLQVFHHDFQALPNGHILVLANTLKSFTNLPNYPGTTNVVGDVVIDLDQNLQPVWVWNEFDHFDVNRHPLGFPDWTHSNTIEYSPDDGNFLVSIRHQNWIVKVNYRDGAGNGDTIWRLGQGGDFKLEGGVDPTDWFYAQHDANFVSSNTTGSFKLAIMDNGNDRMFPAGVSCDTVGNPACLYSTVPIMQVDENARTASFVFHQKLPPSEYSFFAGSTRVQPNSNIEYNLAGIGTSAIIREVTPTQSPQTVWEFRIPNSNTYRAYRMPSLYPGVQW